MLLKLYLRTFLVCALFIGSAAVFGCASHEYQDINTVIAEDMKAIYLSDNVSSLTLEQAVTRALVYNLDARIAEQDYIVSLSDVQLQQLNSLPTISAKREFMKRNNESASSSISADTGVQSLEPSISRERSTRTDMLEANWDVLGSAINLYKSKSAIDRSIISEERMRKVKQNVIMDVHGAFFRAAMGQRLRHSLSEAMDFSDDKLVALKTIRQNGDLPYDQIASIQQELLGNRKQLKNMYQGLSLADYELKALISFPPANELVLIVEDDWMSEDTLPNIKRSLEDYIDIALRKRPEIREELLNLKIAQRGLQSTVLDSFPGLNLLVSANDDDNVFLENSEWYNLTATLSQSITRLLTLPARYAKAEKDIDLANARRQALVAAVVSQIYIAKNLVDQAYQDYSEDMMSYNIAEQEAQRAQILKENGLLGGLEEATKKLGFEIAKIERFDSFAKAYNSYGRLANAAGFDLDRYYNMPVKNAEEINLDDLLVQKAVQSSLKESHLEGGTL